MAGSASRLRHHRGFRVFSFGRLNHQELANVIHRYKADQSAALHNRDSVAVATSKSREHRLEHFGGIRRRTVPFHVVADGRVPAASRQCRE